MMVLAADPEPARSDTVPREVKRMGRFYRPHPEKLQALPLHSWPRVPRLCSGCYAGAIFKQIQFSDHTPLCVNTGSEVSSTTMAAPPAYF